MSVNSIAEARLRAVKRMPYFQVHVMSLHTVETTGVPTMAVDKWCRLYWNREFLSRCCLDEAAATVLHEDLHVWLRHCKRYETHVPESGRDEYTSTLWNFAVDFVVNDIMRRAKVPMPTGSGVDWLDHKAYGFPDNLQAEEYYELLVSKYPKPDPQSGKNGKGGKQGQGGKGKGSIPAQGQPKGKGSGLVDPRDMIGQDLEPGRGGGSSGADGQQRDYEHGEPSQSKPGMTDYEQEHAIRQVARDIQAHAKTSARGTIPGYLIREADKILHPRVDPFRELLSKVKYAVTQTTGHGNYTWRRIPRRNPPSGVRLPAHVQPLPRVLVLVDTSGSMGPDDLALAMGTVRLGLRTVAKDMIRVASADTDIHIVKNVMHTGQVELIGGGGTDMGAAIESAAKLNPPPDVIVCVTDGITPWPQNPVRPRVVACLTRPSDSDFYAVPDWIDSVVIHPEAADEEAYA